MTRVHRLEEDKVEGDRVHCHSIRRKYNVVSPVVKLRSLLTSFAFPCLGLNQVQDRRHVHHRSVASWLWFDGWIAVTLVMTSTDDFRKLPDVSSLLHYMRFLT